VLGPSTGAGCAELDCLFLCSEVRHSITRRHTTCHSFSTLSTRASDTGPCGPWRRQRNCAYATERRCGLKTVPDTPHWQRTGKRKICGCTVQLDDTDEDPDELVPGWEVPFEKVAITRTDDESEDEGGEVQASASFSIAARLMPDRDV
jgi:hypothetical protein